MYDDDDFGDVPQSTGQYLLGVIFGVIALAVAIYLGDRYVG